MLKGSRAGTATDANGNFTINIEGANPTILAWSIAYKSQEVIVGNSSNITI